MNYEKVGLNHVQHPGIQLKERLDEMGMAIKEFALRTGKPEKTIHAVLNGKSSITPEMANLFEQILHTKATYWLALQNEYDLFRISQQMEEKKTHYEEWAKQFPYADMTKKGFVPKTRKIEEKVDNLLQFFNMASIEGWKKLYFEQEIVAQFRVSLSHSPEPHALSAWLRKGEIQAKVQFASDYDEVSLKNALSNFKKLMINEAHDFFPQLQHLCAQAGVKLIYTPGITKSSISGAARWIGENPVVQVSNRFKTYDKFWFTFFHELGHILLHGKREVFLEEVEYSDLDKQKEEEANLFAQKWLLPEDAYQQIVKEGVRNVRDLEFYSRKYETHPSIIYGRLCKEEHLGYGAFGLSYKLELN